MPLRRATVDALRPLLEGRESSDSLLPMPHRSSFSKMLNADLEAVGIEKTNARGEVIDFHALRATFVTNMAKAGVHPKVMQSLARHSDVKLTMDVYTMVDRADQQRAIDGLPVVEGLDAAAASHATDLVSGLVSEGDQACSSVSSGELTEHETNGDAHQPKGPTHDSAKPEIGTPDRATQASESGAPARTRTWDRRIRSPVLYPAELRAHGAPGSAGAS